MCKTIIKNSIRKFSNLTNQNFFQIQNPIKCLPLSSVDKNEGLRDYLTKIYTKSCIGFATTLLIGILNTLFFSYMPVISCTLWISSIPLTFYTLHKISKLESKTLIKNNKLAEEENLKKNNWYNYFSISNGLLISPAILYSITINPIILPISLVSTVGVFGTSTYYALHKKDLSLINYHGPLIGCVGGLFATGIVQFGLLMLGFHEAFNLVNLGSSVVGTAVFTGLIAVDTQLGIKSFDEQKLDSTNVAVNLLLDITNLFLDLLEIITEINKAIKNDD